MGLITASSINFDLLPMDRVVGYYIYDEEDKDVADIRDLLIDKKTHKPIYAIIEIGGFLSIAGKKLLIPWTALTKGGISRMNINCASEHITHTPVAHDQLNPTRVEEESIHFHFSLEPYWVNEQEETIEDGAKPPAITKPAVNDSPINDLLMDNDESTKE